MKKVFCNRCGTLIAELAEGSRIKIGSVHYCPQCEIKKGQNNSMPEFLQGIMGGKR